MPGAPRKSPASAGLFARAGDCDGQSLVPKMCPPCAFSRASKASSRPRVPRVWPVLRGRDRGSGRFARPATKYGSAALRRPISNVSTPRSAWASPHAWRIFGWLDESLSNATTSDRRAWLAGTLAAPRPGERLRNSAFLTLPLDLDSASACALLRYSFLWCFSPRAVPIRTTEHMTSTTQLAVSVAPALTSSRAKKRLRPLPTHATSLSGTEIGSFIRWSS